MKRYRKSRTAIFLALCCWCAVSAGCGRRLVGRVPVQSVPDGGADDADAGSADVSDAADASDALDAPDAPPPTLPEVCTSEGWCWTHPLPTSDRFVQAFAIGDDDLWLIGASGTIVRFAGGVWSTIPSPPTDALSAIWASASDDVWVGGIGGPFHWDGHAWTQTGITSSPSDRVVNGLWGCAPNDVWAVGPVVSRWDGAQWNYVSMPIVPGEFQAVWGSACDDVWVGFLDDAVGSGKILHWDGSAWLTTETRPAEELTGTGPDDVWSLAQGQLFQWSGLGPGTLRDSSTSSLFPVGAAAVGTMNDAHAVTLFAGGGGAGTSLPVAAPPEVSSLFGRSANDIWGFGDLGVVTRWDGAAWTAELPGWALSRDAGVRVTGSGPTDLWAIVGATLLHGDGSTWVAMLGPQDVGGRIYDVWARAPDDVWVLGGDALIHRLTGAGWQTDDPPPRGATTPEMRKIWGNGPDDVWIVRGRNSLLHWDGASWISRQPPVDNLVDVWAVGPNDAWVVGDAVAHWRGDGWDAPRSPAVPGSTPFTAVGGNGPTDVWVLAGSYVWKMSDDYTTFIEAFGTGSRVVALSPTGTVGIWVLIQDDTFAVSRLYRLTGTDPTTDTFQGPLGPAGLNDLWAGPDGTLWATGTGGALIRRRPTP
jgi:hypothetical protein